MVRIAAVPKEATPAAPAVKPPLAVAPAAKKTRAEKVYLPPKNLAKCADEYYRLRNERLELDRQSEAIAKKESACREFLIENLPKSQASGIAGQTVRVSVENKRVVQVVDWDLVWGYIVKNIKKTPGVTGMLQKRINTGMVEEIWAAGKEVPGTAPMDVPVLRVNKL
jgi:hypothetical protein